MESSSEDSSRDSDCTNPDDDSIFRPRRSARLAKKLKYDHDTAPANTTTAGSSTKTVAKAKATAGRKKAAPKKTRKAVVLDILHSFQDKELQDEIQAKLAEQMTMCHCQEMIGVMNSFTEDVTLLKSAVNSHRQIFISLYDETSKGKERHLRFQIEWHAKCSVFLLPKHVPTDKNTSKITSAFRERWLRFIEISTHSVDDCNKIMILFSSAVYNVLLNRIHSESSKSSVQLPSNALLNADGDNVYFRFGGAVISDMLHLRYKQIKATHRDSQKRTIISQQISIIESMNTKEKMDMPEYLQYRDRGYMYSPHLKFILFFRKVDNCVKEIVNDAGFKKYGEDLIKVNNISNKGTIIINSISLGSSFKHE